MSNIKNINKKTLISLTVLLIIAIAIPLTVYISQKRQEIKQHASEDTRVYFTDCTNSSTQPSTLTVPKTAPFNLCLYIYTPSPTLNLTSFDLQISFGQPLTLNTITLGDGGNKFNLNLRDAIDSNAHTFELARATGSSTSFINGKEALLIATLNFTPLSDTGTGTINLTNASSSITGLNTSTTYVTVGYVPLPYTIEQTAPPPTNALDVNRDGCVGQGDIQAWLYDYENPSSSSSCQGTFPDVDKDNNVPDLLDYNKIYSAMINNSASPLCTNNNFDQTCAHKQQ